MSELSPILPDSEADDRIISIRGLRNAFGEQVVHDNLDLDVPPSVRDQCDWMRARPDRDPATLATRLFRPERWARRADGLAARLEETVGPLATGDHGSIADAFVAGAAALRHIGADPLLPPDLLPAHWPGAALRDGYARYQRAFDRAARDWFREPAA